MTWSEGDVWFVTLDIPAGRHEFKVVVDNGAGSYEWEAGPNRSLQVRLCACMSQPVPFDQVLYLPRMTFSQHVFASVAVCVPALLR
jgi:hypothetical protein